MKLQLVRHFWGADMSTGMTPWLDRWRDAGYTALEVCKRHTDGAKLYKALDDYGFSWIAQTFSKGFTTGGTPEEHIQSLREQFNECLDKNPILFNVHSGYDAWSFAEAEDFYGMALDLEKEIGIPVSHETHRMRYFATPWATAPILRKYPTLKLTCDFSHWVCVCERLLPDLEEIVKLAASHAHHVHARVGFEEGPQVPDPRVPAYANHLKAHENWWDWIWASQKERGYEVSTLTPEFGPPGYMHVFPETGKPVADLAEICEWMAARQKERFGSER